MEAANSGLCKTHIMFQANLSFKLLQKYLEVAANAGFVQPDNGTYQLTELGEKFLNEYKHFLEHRDRALEMLDSLDVEREQLTRF